MLTVSACVCFSDHAHLCSRGELPLPCVRDGVHSPSLFHTTQHTHTHTRPYCCKQEMEAGGVGLSEDFRTHLSEKRQFEVERTEASRAATPTTGC